METSGSAWRRRQQQAAAQLRVELCESRGWEREAFDALVEEVKISGPVGWWAHDQLLSLLQLVRLGELVPAWGVCRWVLQQAQRSHAPGMVERAELADQVSRDLHEAESYGADDGTWVLDPEHDWLRRQVLLYELGGLRHFLDHVASPGLVADAELIRAWAQMPMGGYRLVRRGHRELLWRDLADGREHRTADIGSAHFVELGRCAVGRLVPTREREMFESIPLDVPEVTADAVARDPASWVSAIAEAYLDHGLEHPPVDLHHDFGLLNDTPAAWQSWLMTLVEPQLRGGPTTPRDEPDRDDDPEVVRRRVRLHTTACFRVVGEALSGRLQRRLARIDFETQPDVWPGIGRLLLEPECLTPLLDGEDPLTHGDLRRLAELVPEPAAALCRHLLARDAAA